ncbi:MAG TPA: hypothetical protein VIM14_15930 [Polyangia bacterium]
MPNNESASAVKGADPTPGIADAPAIGAATVAKEAPVAPVAPAVASAPPQEMPAPVAKQTVGLAPLDNLPAPVKGKWSPILYGFLAFDMVHDSTQSFSTGSPGYLLIAKKGTFAGDHGRTVFDARGSRFGFRLAAPEMDGMKATAVIEADFVGNQLPMNYGANPTGISENSTYNNGLMRIRHAAIKIESRYVDVLAGQYWQLFGWAPMYLPVTTQIPGYPGVPYGRNTQLRLSHTFKTDPISIELAVAAVRPAQRNAEYPDAHGGARLMVNHWRGVSAVGATGAAFLEMPAGIAVSGIFRRLKVAEFAAAPSKQNGVTGGGVSVDAFLPVIPSSMNNKANALNVTGNFTAGRAIGDMYAPGTIGGAGFPALANPNAVTPAPTWAQDIDNGLVTYEQATGNIHAIKWVTGFAGIQYYLPPSGRVWLAANYGYAKSSNIASYDLAKDKIVTKYTMWDGVAYVNIVGPVTFAAEFAREEQTDGNGKTAKNDRVMGSFYYQFW